VPAENPVGVREHSADRWITEDPRQLPDRAFPFRRKNVIGLRCPERDFMLGVMG
jgi:hypothetical protein